MLFWLMWGPEQPLEALQQPITLIHPCLLAANTAWLFWGCLSNECKFQKVFEGEFLIRHLTNKSPSNIFESMLNAKVIYKGIIGPDGTY